MFNLNYTQIPSPLDQFEIRNLLSLDAPILGNLHISLTNIGLYLTIGGLLILTLSVLTTNYNKIVSNNWSISQEAIYTTIHSIVTSQINPRNGQIYFPFIYALFIFILVNNLVGLVKRSLGINNNILIYKSLCSNICLKFYNSFRSNYFRVPKTWLRIFFFISTRWLSSSFATFISLNRVRFLLCQKCITGIKIRGHMLLNILSGFTYNIMASGIVFFFLGLVPLAFIIAFSGLELGIALIQAQVFVVLSATSCYERCSRSALTWLAELMIAYITRCLLFFFLYYYPTLKIPHSWNF
ncbi:ATP synthase subunit 6 (mitochondrion) [Sclerotinia sclerotiorum 1980 UF-70]|uniref:ATP synthase subunit a n=1 Tax=Sclerotinia sclerotiorum (strain ATCC 18683 / 1980 / Ss-1) TaxID=665079 RepID=A0A0K0PTB2_SCLS1|nr:ATP synthase subunit 6 [Sclerotinia sclerotiorum 1980 UF-70]AKQ53329.1 ATP synthase subunit 6 [Sclerotinia sclerotiorum 1980 UF-70]